MTILCATDLSDLSWEAAQAAAAIASRTREIVELVHVVPEHLSGVDQQLKSVRLDEDTERLATRFDVRVKQRILQGNPAREITSLADALEASIVVLSSRGTSRHDHWIHPSVAEAVASASPCPTLVVRDSLCILEWAFGERALSAMVGVGLDASSKAALTWTAKLRELAPCDLMVSQIVWPFAEHRRFGVDGGVDPERLSAEATSVHLRELEDWAGSVPGAGTTRFEVRPGWGRVDTHLTQRAAAAGADLLVVGSHQRAGVQRLVHGSISSGVIHYASCNVLCVPTRAVPAQKPEVRAFDSVLIPVDFSERSRRAIAHAYGLIRPGGVAHLVHVLTPGEREAEPDVLAVLQRLVPAGALGRGIETRVHVLIDESPSTAILQAEARLGVDAICMAMRSHSSVSALLLGSQAQQVLRAAHCPVMLVGAESES